MANEIVYSGIGDLTVASVMSSEALLLLADRNALMNHPALLYAGDSKGSSSVAMKIPHLGLMGYDILASTGDGSAVANTALTDGSTTVTPARYSKSYEQSDLARFTVQGGILDPSMFAQDAVVSSGATLVDIIANLVDDFATVVGTSGVDATFQNWLDCKRALDVQNVQGPLLAIIHPTQWHDILQDLALNTGGAAQFMPATQEMINSRGNGFKGQLAGVDVFTTTRVPTANAAADRAGGMFGRGAIVWGDTGLDADDPNNQISIGGKILFERDRTAKSGLTAYVTHRYLGATEGIDLAGVSIITDA